MEQHNKKLLSKYANWREFEEHSDTFVGKVPRIFESIHDEALLSTKDVAELMEVHEETVRKWIRSNKIRVHSPVGRYKIWGEDLKEFIYSWWRNDFLKDDE